IIGVEDESRPVYFVEETGEFRESWLAVEAGTDVADRLLRACRIQLSRKPYAASGLTGPRDGRRVLVEDVSAELELWIFYTIDELTRTCLLRWAHLAPRAVTGE